MANFRVRVNEQELLFPYSISFEECLHQLRKEVPEPQLKYLDEEAELITVDNQLEFLEALDTLRATNGWFQVLTVPGHGSTIAKLPMVESYITPFGQKQDVGQQAEQVQGRDRSAGRDLQDASFNTAAVNRVDSSSQHQAPDCNAKMTGPDNADKAMNSYQNNSQSICTEAILTSSVALGTQAIHVDSKEAQVNAENIQDQMRTLIRQEINSFLISSQNLKPFEGSVCFRCKTSPIYNVKYTCEECPWVVVCELCEENFDHEHDLLKHRVTNKAPPPANQRPGNRNEILLKLRDMGFENEEEMERALAQANQDFDATVSILLNL